MVTPQQIPTPDGRSLDVWLAGPADGTPLVFHMGTPSSGMPFDAHVAAMAERPHLLPEHGHLSLAVDAFPRILDALIGGHA